MTTTLVTPTEPWTTAPVRTARDAAQHLTDAGHHVHYEAGNTPTCFSEHCDPIPVLLQGTV